MAEFGGEKVVHTQMQRAKWWGFSVTMRLAHPNQNV
jgi:hypothetical protein